MAKVNWWFGRWSTSSLATPARSHAAADGGSSGWRRRMELPFSAKRWALLTNRSTIASANVGIASGQCGMPVLHRQFADDDVERTWLRSSITSSRSLASTVRGGVTMKSSRTSTPISASAASRRGYRDRHSGETRDPGRLQPPRHLHVLACVFLHTFYAEVVESWTTLGPFGIQLFPGVRPTGTGSAAAGSATPRVTSQLLWAA